MRLSYIFENMLRTSGLAAVVGTLAVSMASAQIFVDQPLIPDSPSLGMDTDGDGVTDDQDNCVGVANSGTRSCDTDNDGFGNACDGDFDQSGSTNSKDFVQWFLADFQRGTDIGRGTDLDCDGKVTVSDFRLFIDNFIVGEPGPGLSETGGAIVAEKTKDLGGQKFTFQKHMNASGASWEVVVDAAGQPVDPQRLPTQKRPITDPKVSEVIAQIRGGLVRQDTVKVSVATDFDLNPPLDTPDVGEVEVMDGQVVTASLNGKRVSPSQLDGLDTVRMARLDEQATLWTEERHNLIRGWAAQHGLGDHAGIKLGLESTSSNLVLDLTPGQVEKLAADRMVQGIELYEEPKTELAAAMAATNVTGWAHPFATSRGAGMGVYMTESGCPSAVHIPANYENRDGTAATDHSRNVGAIIRGVAPDSFIYCRGGSQLPTFTDLFGAFLNSMFPGSPFDELDGPAIQAVTMSMMLGGGTQYRTTDRDWDNFIYNYQIPAFKSAGNQGGGTGVVTSPGKGLNVIAVGNYNDATNTINAGSSSVDPETGNEKPEITAPGTSITAGGFTKTGTSMASPHAAGFAADTLSQYSYLRRRPHLVKANLMSGATDPIAGSAEAVGAGGIDYLSTAYNGRNTWWSGNNAQFHVWDAADGSADSWVEREYFISSGWENVRATLSWLTRGHFTYAHRTDAHPIGMDLDFQVLDPSGSVLAASYSWDNSFESVEFSPTTSGTYTFRIHRYANRDPANKMRMGLAIDYFNE